MRFALAFVGIAALQTIPAATGLRFLAEIERRGQARGCEQLEGLALEFVLGFRESAAVTPTAEAIEAGQQGTTVREAAQVHALQSDVPPINRLYLESGMGRSQVAWLPRRSTEDEASVGVHRGQIDGRRHARHPRSELLG